MKKLLLSFLCFISFTLSAQLNIELRSNIPYELTRGAQLSSIWGYVDELGNEYAIVGTDRGTAIVDVTDPDQPVEIFWRPGTYNIWREAKTYGDYAYISSESGEGLLVIDLSPLPQSTNLTYNYYNGSNGVTFTKIHTLWVDEPTGYLYLFGVDYNGGSGIICNLNTSLTEPPVENVFSSEYIHDGIIQGDRMYTGNILDGFFRIYDVTDRVNPVLMGESMTPHTFTHNVAPTPDNQFAFTTDEVANAFIASYDVSDPTNIRELDRIRSTDGTSIIPHNVHYKANNFLVTSYYTDGVLIHDVSRPHNMVKVGNYDTTPLSSANFDGCWGVYPYFPSGTIVASDIQRGLYVLTPTYKRAGYLEGKVYDAVTNEVLSNVKVEITDRTKYSNSEGEYGVGTVEESSMQVTFSKLGYETYTTTQNFVSGQVIDLDVYLTPLEAFEFKVKVIDDATNLPVLEANVAVDMLEGLESEGQTNGLGERVFNLYYETDYSVTVALWGYKFYCQHMLINAETGELVVRLEKGYSDNFRFDLGWTHYSSAVSGRWERGIPFESEGGANPGVDSPDCDKYAYVTGNSTEFGISADDVDGGFTRLMSPAMDLSGFTDPHINFHYWFYNFYGESTPNDKMKLLITTNTEAADLEEIFAPSTFDDMFHWYYKSIPINGLVSNLQNVYFVIYVYDEADADNITEGGIDNFSVTNSNAMATSQIMTNSWVVYPNPFTDELFVGEVDAVDIKLVDIQGKEITVEWKKEGVINTTNVQAGVYLLYHQGMVTKVIKK